MASTHLTNKDICCSKEKRRIRKEIKLCDEHNIDKKGRHACRREVAAESGERSKLCVARDKINNLANHPIPGSSPAFSNHF